VEPYYSDTAPSNPIGQGDIFSVHAGDELEGWAVMVTADCDIHQNKYGGHLTYVPIISSQSYIDQIWAPERISENSRKHITSAINIIFDIDKQRDSEVRKMGANDLLGWLSAEGPKNISKAFPEAKKTVSDKLLAELRLIEVLRTQPPGNMFENIKTLKSYWNDKGINESAQKDLLFQSINSSRTEFFHVPSIPGGDQHGYIALLRYPRTIKDHSVFRSHSDWKLSGIQGPCLIRIGRFADYLRYSIAQQFGILFSRIGLRSSYEDECKASADLTVEYINGGVW